MSEIFEGCVKAAPIKVGKAIERYTEALDKACNIVESLRKQAKTDVRVKKGWFGIKYSNTVEKWIKEDLHDVWFLSDVDFLLQYYPDQITTIDVSLVTTKNTSPAYGIKAMFEHNTDEIYLTPTQAQWVETWSKK